MSNQDRIVVDPDIRAGKPVVKGTRIPVHLILELLESDHSIDDIVEQYPDLERKDVKAAISYATSIVDREIDDRSAVA